MNTREVKYAVEYMPQAIDDLTKLDNSVRVRVISGIEKASYNPLPKAEGGYGKPLGNKQGRNLTNLLEVKFRGMGIRAVYKLVRMDKIMKIVVVSVREDEIVFKEALKRANKYI